MNQTKENALKPSLLERWLIWLAAADSEVLSKSPGEVLKYTAFGATLLVPFLFGMIAAAYAVSTLTENLIIITGFALIWGFIIITVDRALLATYRAHVALGKKLLQFCLRATVAVLMGLTVSHPLTLMLFKDTINSEIEKTRAEEMAAALESTEAAKQEINDRIQIATANLQKHQQKYQEIVGGNFLNQPSEPVQQVANTPVNTAANSQFSDIDNQISELRRERDQVQADLNRWQQTYDEEIAGTRSGTPGIGPAARAIERDELAWRREEIRRLNGVVAELTKSRNDLSSSLMARKAEANAQLEESRRELEKQKLEMFTNQQGQLLEVIRGQINSASDELNGLREEAAQLAENTKDRVAGLKTEKRADIMVQTIVLHHLFEKEGGKFALAVYIVIASLFTLIDTIPLIVKFFSPPGLYDKYLENKEAEAKLDEKQAEKLRDRLLDESKYSKIPSAWMNHAQQEFEKLQYLKDAAKLGVNVEDLHISDLNEPDEFDSIDASGLAIPTRSNFSAKFELKGNLDKFQHDKKPEKYLALDFTPETARESAKWLLEQADLCTEKGLRGIRIWGSLWTKRQIGKFDGDTHKWGQHAKMLDFDKDKSQQIDEPERNSSKEELRQQTTETSVEPKQAAPKAKNGHGKSNGHESRSPEPNQFPVPMVDPAKPISQQPPPPAPAPATQPAPVHTSAPAPQETQAHAAPRKEPNFNAYRKTEVQQNTVVEHPAPPQPEVEKKAVEQARPKNEFVDGMDPAKQATAGSNPDMPVARRIGDRTAQKVVEKPATPDNAVPIENEKPAQPTPSQVVQTPPAPEPKAQPQPEPVTKERRQRKTVTAGVSGSQPKIGGQLAPAPPTAEAPKPFVAPAKIVEDQNPQPSVSRSSSQTSGRLSIPKPVTEKKEDSFYSPLQGDVGFGQMMQDAEFQNGPENYAEKLNEVADASMSRPLSLKKTRGKG